MHFRNPLKSFSERLGGQEALYRGFLNLNRYKVVLVSLPLIDYSD